MPQSEQISAVLWSLGVGVIWVVTIWLVVANAWFRSATGDTIPDTDVKPTPIGIVDEYPEGLGEAHGGPTVFLKVLIISFIIWAVGYVGWYFYARFII